MRFKFKFGNAENKFNLFFENTDCYFKAKIRTGAGTTYPVYDGEYEVFPKVVQQVLETKDKILVDNVLIREIQKYETSNPQGGYTCYIANN